MPLANEIADRFTAGMKEVSSAFFFETVGQMNVHPKPVEETLRDGPYVSIWETPRREKMGVSVAARGGAKRYWVPAGWEA